MFMMDELITDGIASFQSNYLTDHPETHRRAPKEFYKPVKVKDLY